MTPDEVQIFRLGFKKPLIERAMSGFTLSSAVSAREARPEGQDNHRNEHGHHQTGGHFPSDEVAPKQLGLALRIVLAKRVRPICDWRPVMSQFAVLFGARFTGSEA